MADWKITKEDVSSTKEAGMMMIYGISIAFISVSVTILWAIYMLLCIPIGIIWDFIDWTKRKLCKTST
jgi:hypothetical protein